MSDSSAFGIRYHPHSPKQCVRVHPQGWSTPNSPTATSRFLFVSYCSTRSPQDGPSLLCASPGERGDCVGCYETQRGDGYGREQSTGSLVVRLYPSGKPFPEDVCPCILDGSAAHRGSEMPWGSGAAIRNQAIFASPVRQRCRRFAGCVLKVESNPNTLNFHKFYYNKNL